MHNKSITELSAALQHRKISSRELTRHFLDRIRHEIEDKAEREHRQDAKGDTLEEVDGHRRFGRL